MRIAICNPFCWPEVRRGSERIVHELSRFLHERGHRVSVISSHRGASREEDREGVHYFLFRQRFAEHPNRWLSPLHGFVPDCYRVLRRESFDAVHCMTYFDGFAAACAKSAHPAPARLVLHLVGIPIRRYFRTIPHDYLMFRRALARADRIIACSRFAVDSLVREFGYPAERLPVPVDLGQFDPKPGPTAGPVCLLFMGDVNEKRKGAELLLRAFPNIREHCPDCRLVFSGQISEARRRNLLAMIPEMLRSEVEFRGVGELSSLPVLLREATVMVLPSIWETFGMVYLEALASGTPVVGARHSGVPEVIADTAVGTLFEPLPLEGAAGNAEGLVEAVLRSVELARHPDTAGRCRRHAETFGWEKLGPAYEELYADR